MTLPVPNLDDRPQAAYAETLFRFPVDALLRRCGFVIKDRPTHGEAIWRRGKEKYTYSEAIALVQKERGKKR